jgi:glycosidase
MAILPSFPVTATSIGTRSSKAWRRKSGMAASTLIWMPPPSYAGDFSAGYNPKEYFRLDNSYGTVDEHRAALQALLQNGVEPVADIVINHRDGRSGWADFKNPDWGVWAICKTDQAFSNTASGITNTPDNQKGNCEEQADYRPEGTYQYPTSAISRIPIRASARISNVICCN